jgi:hypothetical protein
MKLTDTQLVLLSAASQRHDGAANGASLCGPEGPIAALSGSCPAGQQLADHLVGRAALEATEEAGADNQTEVIASALGHAEDQEIRPTRGAIKHAHRS